MTPIKTIVSTLRSEYNLDFNKLSWHRLKDEEEEAYKNKKFSCSYRLAIAADIKQLISDKTLHHEDRNFYISTLTEEFLKVN